VLVIPLIGLRSAPWKLDAIPSARRTRNWRLGVAVFLALGLGLVFLLWACFLVDYSTTRNVYFLAALLHVLAEIPYLLRVI
jgi:hypothetical protein